MSIDELVAVAEPPSPVETPRRLTGAVVALCVALLATLGSGAYLYSVAGRWQDRAEQVSAERADLQAQLGQLQADHAALQQRADGLEAELGQASDRVRDLSDEKAKVADQREVNAQKAQRNFDVAQSASDVATAMGTCASSMRELLDVVLASPDYDYALAQRTASGADAACAQAQELQQRFVADLEG